MAHWSDSSEMARLTRLLLKATKRGVSKPSLLQKPRPRGRRKQNPARHSQTGSVSQVTAFRVQEPCGSGWSFCGSNT